MYDKLSDIFYDLHRFFGNKSLYFDLRHHIDNKQNAFIPVKHFNGIDILEVLMQLARKYRCPIIVGSEDMARNMVIMSNYEIDILCGKNVKDVIGIKSDLALIYKPNKEVIDYLVENNKQIVGFVD